MKELPHGLKLATVWLVLGTLVFLGVQAWLAERSRARFTTEAGVIEIRRSADGHYHWPGTLDGHAIDFLVDTGATSTAIPGPLAEQLRLPRIGSMQGRTAGGAVTGSVVRADLQLQGGVRLSGARLAALPDLHAPLLGMDVLGRLRWQQADGVLRIEPQPAR